MPGHRRLCEGRDFELARFPGHRGRCAIDAGDQSERLGGGANVLGETQAAVVVACILQRGTAIRSAGGYLRGLDPESGGRGILAWADPDVADQHPITREAYRLTEPVSASVLKFQRRLRYGCYKARAKPMRPPARPTTG